MHFLTGFPGFLGYEYIRRALPKDPSIQFYCLTQSKFKDLAVETIQKMEQIVPGARLRIHLIEGDITEEGLGFKEPPLWKSQIRQIFHFAAVYDLSVSEALGKKINVEGTRHMIEFAETLPRLERFHYVSTCYVSGIYNGVFLESDLEKNQRFNNFYESTKHEAEVTVKTSMKRGLPATIYRPAIVVGNSKTGETQKYDGPYYVIQWLLRNPKLALLPKLGDPEKTFVNLVPSDFVIEAIVALANDPEAIGKTFQLADPNPLSVKDLVEQLAKDVGSRIVNVPLPKFLTQGLIGRVPYLEDWLKIPKTSLDYFVHPTRYDVTESSRFLSTHGISCPPIRNYSKVIVDYMRANPHIRSHALR